MKKSFFKFTSFILMIMLLMSSFAGLSVTAEDIEDNYVWSKETPFIMYEDEKGIRYIGPTGDEASDNCTDVFETECEENVRYSGELAPAAGNTLPSQVDISTSKYFPAIGNQGSLGSCATWATVYYQFTYEMNRMRGTTATPENTAAPNFVYNILSHKDASGTSAEENYAVLKTQGVPPITLLPYSDKEHLSWNADEKIWREALNWRLKDYKHLEYIGRDGKEITSATDPDLDEIKTALSNGQMVTFSSFMNSWVYDTIKTHSDAPENSKYAGEKIVKYLDGIKGSHRMVIVGYNDELWFDHNSNGKVDLGEKGAFKIANSWGTDFANKGFCWVSYDAVNYESSVEGGYSKSDREGAMSDFTTITVRPYKEGSGIYLKFTLNTADRTQFFLNVTSEHNGTSEKAYFLSGINYSLKSDNQFSLLGKTVAEDGTLCFPLDNVSPELNSENFNEYTFSVTIKDSKADSKPLKVKSLELVNEYEGKTYKPSAALPTLDGSEQTIDIKACDTDNKVIYYIGYDEPILHYRQNGIWQEAQMEKNEEHLGHNYKYVIKNIPEDAYVYFSDQNGNTDNNSGSYYVAKDRLNYFRTKGVRDELVLKDFCHDPEILDAGTNGNLISEVTGGYEPYYFQYTVEHIESGVVKVEKFRAIEETMHYFEKAGQYRITAEVKDQTGDIASLTKVITITDMPFIFTELTATSQQGGNLFAGDPVTFYARTNFEEIMYMRNAYEFAIKDSNGKVCHEASVKPFNCSTNFGYSIIYYDWTPAKKGVYTATISETDGNNEYAEKSLTFTVLDKIYGDADGDGEVNVKDATAIQKCLAGLNQDFVLMKELADCDTNNVLSIKDATCIRKYLANIKGTGKTGEVIGYVPPVTEPESQPVTEPKPVSKNTVTFTNSFNWSGTISCYYWSDSNKNMTTWPGKTMTKAGTNEFGEAYYTFNVPDGATYVIFTNGKAQTVDISYSGGDVRYYPLTKTNANGHYEVSKW
ncbi:MAG: starch-binding protein [Clostridia bacterium]|nr:starch-binding protein [Clostridia bacterium]